MSLIVGSRRTANAQHDKLLDAETNEPMICLISRKLMPSRNSGEKTMIERMTGKALASIISLAIVTQPVFAKSAGKLSSLVGARGSSGEMELEASGFTYVTGHSGKHGKVHSYWWHHKDKNCVHVITADGRYTDITDAPNSDCNHKDSGGSAGAVAGAAAGAVLLAALMSHKSGHHDGGKHLTGSADEAQYERGYNDGLYNTSYHNYDRSDSYSQGYQNGVEQRQRNTSYHSGSAGYAAHAYIADLQGMDSIRAIDELTSRGFADVDAFSSGNTQYGIYYNRRTNQCVQATYADTKVYDIRDIGSHPKCR